MFSQNHVLVGVTNTESWAVIERILRCRNVPHHDSSPDRPRLSVMIEPITLKQCYRGNDRVFHGENSLCGDGVHLHRGKTAQP
jgi:hypothetical protein